MKGGFWLTAYDVILPPAELMFRIGGLFSSKIKGSMKGRFQGFDGWTLGEPDERPCILIHTASRGEFEGALPLIERLIAENRYRVAVSFSSPSTVSAVKAVKGLWGYGYVAFDYLRDQLQFLQRIDPSAILIFKHDFWPNTLRAADVLNIPVLLVNANFHPNSKRFLPIVSSFNRRVIRSLRAIWTVSQGDMDRVEPIVDRHTDLRVMGDTRYDRVSQRAKEGKDKFGLLKSALGAGPVIVLGSSWQPDEKICYNAFSAIRKEHPSAKMIIVPHEPGEDALQRNRELAKHYGFSTLLYSDWVTEGKIINEDVLLLDQMGLLAGLYSVGWCAHVGGVFGVGVHSVIEPAAHGIPVTFGPNHYVSHEATLLLEAKGGYAVRTANDIEKLWRLWLDDTSAYQATATAADQVVKSREGATNRLLEWLNGILN